MADIRETGTSGLKFGEGTLNNNSSEINFEELMSNIGSLKRASALELNTIFKPSYSEPIGVKLAQAGYGNSVYDENAVSDWDLDNLNEVRAANQPGILLLGNGALKMVSTGVTTFLDSTVGALYGLGTGIANAVAAEEGERGEAFIRGLWDNDFNQAMTSIQDSMEELLPNYYSLDELNSPWYSNILSGNFIGDKVLKNMGFTIGALGAMALTGGIGGAVGKGALAAAKFALGNLGKALGASRGTLAGINNFARGTGQFSNWLVNTAISANGEAAIEAINAQKEGLKDAYANLDSRRLELINSLDPDSPDYFTQLGAIDKASQEYKDEIDRLFRDAGNSVYLANLAILGASNTLEFGHILKGGFGKSAKLADYELRANGEKVALSDWIKAGVRGEKIGIENTVDKGFGRIAGITAKNILTEGTEEATQNLASNTAKLYAKAKGNEFAENSILGARINPEVTDEITDYTKAFSKALYDNFGSPESPGWEEFFLGGLTGGMGFMSLGNVKLKDAEGNYVIDPKTLKVMTKLRPIWEGGFMQAKRQVLEEYEDNQRIVDAVNKKLQDPEFIKRFQHSVASQKFSEDMSAALERNDMVEFKNSDMGRITNDVFFFRDAGMIDEYKALYKQMALGIDDKTLEQLYTATADESGNTALAQEDMEKVRNEYLGKALRMLDKIEMVQQYYDFVDLEYRDRSPLFKEELAYLYVRLDDTNRRIKQLKDKAPSEISATLSAIKGYFKEGNELDFSQYNNNNLTDLERQDLERLERLKKQYEEKIKEYTKNPEKLDRDINLAYLEGEAKRASLDALNLIKQLKEAKTAKEVDSIIAFADESVREEVWKAAYQDGDDEVKEKIEMAIETLNAFAKTKERLQKVFRGTPEIAEIFEAMMRNLYINNELNPEKIREAMRALQQGIESENPDALSQYTDAFDLVANNLFGEENKKTRDLMLNFLESSLEQLGNTLRELQKYKTARETSLRVQQQQQLQQQLLQAALNQKQLAKTNKDHLSKIQLNKALRKAINKGTHVAVKKFGKDKLNELIDKVIAQGNFEGSETDIESVLNTLSNVFQDKYGKERSTAGVLDTINRYSNSNINPYRKAVGQVLQQQYNSQQPASQLQQLQQQPQQQGPKDYLGTVKNAQELALEIKSGTHVAILKLGRDKVNSILGTAIAEGNLSGDEADIENLMNFLQEIFSQSSDADIKNKIDTFASKLNVYKKSIGKALQKEWAPKKSAPDTSKEDAEEEAEAVAKAMERINISNATTDSLRELDNRAMAVLSNSSISKELRDKVADARNKIIKELNNRNAADTWEVDPNVTITKEIANNEFNARYTEAAYAEFVSKQEQSKLKATADYLNGKYDDKQYLAALGYFAGWLNSPTTTQEEIANTAKKESEPRKKYLKNKKNLNTVSKEDAEAALRSAGKQMKDAMDSSANIEEMEALLELGQLAITQAREAGVGEGIIKNIEMIHKGLQIKYDHHKKVGGSNGSVFQVLDKTVQPLVAALYKKLGRTPLSFSMEDLKLIAMNMAKTLSLINNGLSVPSDLAAYEDIILASKPDNNLPSLSEDNPFVVGSDDEFNGIWTGLYDVSGANPLQTEHKANLANEQKLAAHYGSVEKAKKVQWIVDYLLKDIKDAPVNLITYVGDYFPNGNPKTTIYTAIKVSDIRGDQRKRTARTKGWIQTVDGEDYLVIGILGASSNNQTQIDNYEAIRADFNDQISSLGIAEGWHASTNPAHVMQITNIGDGRFAMNHFDLNNWNSDDIVELLTGPNKEVSNPLHVDPKKGQLKFSIQYEDEPKFVNKSNKDVVRKGSANLQPGKMYVLIPTPNGAYYRFPIQEVTIDESKEHYKQNGSDNKLVKEVDRLISAIIDKQEVKDIIALKNLLVLENESQELSFLDIYFDNGEIRVEYIPRRNEAHSKANRNSVFLDATSKAAAKAQLFDIIYNQIRPFINVNLSNTSSWEGVKKLSEAGALRLKRPLAVFSFVGANYTVKFATTKKGSKPEEKRRRLNSVINEQQINFNGRTIFLRDNNFYEKESLITNPKEIEILQDLVAINNGNYVGETIYKKKKTKLVPLQGTYYFVERGVTAVYHKDTNGNFTRLTGTDAAEILSRRKNKPSTATPSFTISIETASALLEEKMQREMNGSSSQNEPAKALGLSEEDMKYYPQAKAWLEANWESDPHSSSLLRALRIGYNRANRLIEAWKAEKSTPTSTPSNGLGISVETATPEQERAFRQSADAAAPFMEGLNKATTNQLVAAVLKSATDANIDGTISQEQFKRINEAATAKLSLIAKDTKVKTEARKADAVKRAIYDLELKKGVKVGDTVEINGNQLKVVSVEYDEGVANAPNNDSYGYSDIPGTVVLRLSNENSLPFAYGVTRFLNGVNNKKINKQSQKPLKGLDNSNNSSTFVNRIKDSSDSEGAKLLDFLYEKVNDINASKKTKIDADDLTLSQLIQTYKDVLDIDLTTLPSDITLELLEDIINCKL